MCVCVCVGLSGEGMTTILAALPLLWLTLTDDGSLTPIVSVTASSVCAWSLSLPSVSDG